MNQSKGKYFVKRNESDTFEDITDMFDGVAVLSLDGFNERGDAVNVYHAQWIDSQTEDFLVTTRDAYNHDIIIRNNVDLSLTVAISERYRTTNDAFDEQTTYDNLLDYICNRGAFYIKSTYMNKIAKVVCLNGFKPTTQKLNRGAKGYILVTITLHTLDNSTSIS